MHRVSIAHILSVLLIIVLPLLFFGHLFFPLKLYYIADYTTSDVMSVSFAQKYELWNALQNNSLPFLTPLLAHGYPLVGESQVGALNPINILMYKFLNPVVAFNFSYVISFLIMGIGTYAFIYYLTRRSLLSLFAALSYMFSGTVLLQLMHPGIIQAVAFIPLTTFFSYCAATKRSIRWSILGGFTLALQILYGHYMIAIGQSIIIVLVFAHFSYKNIRTVAYIVPLVATAFLISLPQIVQTALFLADSPRDGSAVSGQYFPAYSLATLFTPFPFGSVKNGEFFRYFNTHAIGPWEANLFIGYGMVLLALYLLYRSIRKPISIPTWILVCIIFSAILATGRNSVFSLITSLPFLSSLRAYTRFYLFTSFFMIILIAVAATRHKISNTIILLCFVASMAGIIVHFVFLYPTVSIDQVFKKSALLPTLGNYIAVGISKPYVNTFIRHGYSALDTYLPLHSYGNPYGNFLFRTPRCDIFEYSYFNPSLLQSLAPQVNIEYEQWRAYQQNDYVRTLQMLGCDTVVDTMRKRAFHIQGTQPPVMVSNKIESYFSISDMYSNMLRNNEEKVFTVAPIELPRGELKSSVIYKKNGNSWDITVTSDGEAVVVIRQLYVPGLYARVNNAPSSLFRANLIFTGIKINKGTSHIELRHSPPYVVPSLVAMTIGYLFVIGALAAFVYTAYSNKKTYRGR